jgi:hypothetical protein
MLDRATNLVRPVTEPHLIRNTWDKVETCICVRFVQKNDDKHRRCENFKFDLRIEILMKDCAGGKGALSTYLIKH